MTSAAEWLDKTVNPGAEVLVWASNGQHPMDDMVAEWLAEGLISAEQAEATSEARKVATAEFFKAYRERQPAKPSAEERYEMLAAFGPGTEVVDVISGRRTQL